MDKNLEMPILLNTLKQASARTGFGVPTLRKAMYDGELKVKKYGRAVRIAESDLIDYLNSAAEEKTVERGRRFGRSDADGSKG